MDNPLLQKLMEVLGKKQQAPAAPVQPEINELRPWDSPVLQHPSMQAMPQEMMGQPSIPQTNPGGDVTPADDAMLQALLKKKINQEFARAGQQPIPE